MNTTEQILTTISQLIQDKIKEQGWLLLFAEISENPTCSYYIDFTKKYTSIYCGYKVTSFLNARHTTYFNNKEDTHNHTWEYIVRIISQNNEQIHFQMLKQTIKDVLKPLQGNLLNKQSMFREMSPTMENINNEVTKEIEKRLNPYGLNVIYSEIFENSFCSFFVDKSESFI